MSLHRRDTPSYNNSDKHIYPDNPCEHEVEYEEEMATITETDHYPTNK